LAPQGHQILRLEQRIDGQIELGALFSGQGRQCRQLLQGEVLSSHPGRECFETAVHGIGTGCKGGQKGVPVSGRGQYFRFGADKITGFASNDLTHGNAFHINRHGRFQ
jgi:hypothetical protein